MQSSSLYVTDGDEIDWAYGKEHIFMYTFELYPSHAQVSSTKRFYPPDEVIGPQTERNRNAILMLIEAAGCPLRAHRQGGGELRCAVRRLRDVRRLDRPIQLGTDTATAGAWQRGNPAATARQKGTTVSGSEALVTGKKAGRTARSYDVDGGVTTVRSAPIALPASVGALTFRYYLAHSSNATSADYLRAYVERADGSRTLVLQELGAPNTDRPAWASASIPMTPMGRRDRPDRLRRGRPRAGEHDRGRRRRRPDQASLSGNRKRIVVPSPGRDSASMSPPWAVTS